MEPEVVQIANLIDFGQCIFSGTVTSKRPVGYTKAGKPWFSFVLEDEQCDVKVSVFTKAEELDKLIVVGSCYKFENALIRIKSDQSKKFDHCKSDYEVNIKDNTIVEEIENRKMLHEAQVLRDIKEAIQIKYSNRPESMEIVKIMVKVLSVQINAGETSEGAPWKRADLVVADATDSTRLSVWMSDEQDKQDKDYEALAGTCIGVTGVIVKGREEYGPQFRLSKSSQLFSEKELPDNFKNAEEFIEAKEQISGHLEAGQPGSPQGKELSQFLPLSSLESTAQKSLVTIIFNNDAERQVYLGCSICKKKCDSSGKTVCQCDESEPQHYYKLYGAISDTTGQHAITIFDPTATEILGISVEEFVSMEVVSREKLLMNAFEAALVLKLMPPKDDNREKLVVLSADQHINYWDYLRGELDNLVGSAALHIGLQ